MNRHTPGDVLSAFAVVSLIGWPFLIVFAIGVSVLLWVTRLVLVVVALLATVALFLGRELRALRAHAPTV